MQLIGPEEAYHEYRRLSRRGGGVSSRSSRRTNAAPINTNWTPPGSPTVWWDPAKTASGIQSGGFFTQLKDLTGNGNDSAVMAGTTRPTVTTLGGIVAMGQQGVSHVDLTFGSAQSDFTIIMAVGAGTLAATYNAMASFGSFSPGLYVHAGACDWYNGGDHAFSDLTWANNDIAVVCWWHNSNAGSCSKNATESASNPVAVAPTEGTSFSLFTEQAGASGSPWPGQIGAFVYYPSDIGPTIRHSVRDHYRSVYGSP